MTGAAALRQAEQVRKDHYDEDVWTDDVLRIAAGLNPEFFTISEILDALLIPRAQQNKLAQIRVAGILRVNGYEQCSKRMGKGDQKRRGWKRNLSHMQA